MKPALTTIWLIIIGTGLTIILIKAGLERIKTDLHRYRQAWLKRQLQNMTTNKHAAEAAEKAAQQHNPRQPCTCHTNGNDAQWGFCAVHDAEPELNQKRGWPEMRWRLRRWDMGLGTGVRLDLYGCGNKQNHAKNSAQEGRVVSLSWYRAGK